MVVMISSVTKMILRADSDPAHFPCCAIIPEAFAVARVGKRLEVSFLAIFVYSHTDFFTRTACYILHYDQINEVAIHERYDPTYDQYHYHDEKV
jgi:hypothetical protein